MTKEGKGTQTPMEIVNEKPASKVAGKFIPPKKSGKKRGRGRGARGGRK